LIVIATCLWAPNKHSLPFSRHYTETDVEKLYRGFERNLTVPFRFICWTDRTRQFAEPIEQRQIKGVPNYGTMIQPFEMNEPMIIVGLDTIVVGNCDHLAEYALSAERLAVPRDPFYPQTVCNGVALVPTGHAWVSHDKAEDNDMDWIRTIWKRGQADVIDDLFPGQVVSYKGEVKKHGLTDETRIVYFHGQDKPHELPHVGWIARHWHDNAREFA
jgi:hypothetical protein